MKPGELIVVEMPFYAGLKISRPERLALKFNGAETLSHIWTFAYLKRGKKKGNPSEWPIDESSLHEARLPVIIKLATTLAHMMLTKGWAPSGASKQFAMLRGFMDWLDDSDKGSLVWIERQATELAFAEYCKYLTFRASTGSMSTKLAAAQQQMLLAFAREFYDESFCKRFKTLRQTNGQPTRVPDEEELRIFGSWMAEFFSVSSETIISAKPFPIAFTDRHSTSNNLIWLIPNGKARSTQGNSSCGAAWNTETGTLRSVDEVEVIYSANNKSPRNQAQRAVRQATRILKEANTDRFHPERLNLASFGCLAFGALFALETGINQSVLQNLEYSEVLAQKVRRGDVSRAKFRALKLRAGGKEIPVSISLRFIPQFLRYLDLREYILRGASSDALFLFVDATGQAVPYPSGWFQRNLKKRVKRLGISLPKIGLRKIRAAKQDHLIRHATPEVAASVMGHSLATALRAYSNGSQTTHALEMGRYLISLEETVLKDTEERDVNIQNGVGICTGFNRPSPVSQTVPVSPMCDSTEGCLFCDKYRIHADETDVRKLLSCRYCLKLTFGAKGDIEMTQGVLRKILLRIEDLLDELRKVNGLLVDKIEHEVEQEERLDPFWVTKLEQLATLGVI